MAPSAGNFRINDSIDPGAFNGGQAYVKERQDIYVAEKIEEPNSLVVNGKLTCENGSIWVKYAADASPGETNNYMLKPFAAWDSALISGEKVNLSEPDLEQTLKAFRNACNDGITDCGGEYLTGQQLENINLIYWTGSLGISPVTHP